MSRCDEDGVPWRGEELDRYLRALDDDGLAALRLDVEEKRRSIEAQIDQAKAEHFATGKYANPDWWARVQSAKRSCGYRIMAIGAENGRRKRERVAKAQAESALIPSVWERTFVRVAKQTLEAEKYMQLKRLTDLVMEQRQEEAAP